MAKSTKNGPGRPRHPDPKCEHVATRLTRTERATLETVAAHHEISLCEAIRRAVLVYLRTDGDRL